MITQSSSENNPIYVDKCGPIVLFLPICYNITEQPTKAGKDMAATRNTKQKQLVLSLLEGAERPLTAGEVFERAVRQNSGIAKSTVYRILASMLSRGEVSQGLLQNGESFFTVANGHGHLHYMICKGCSRMLNFPKCPLADMEREIAESSGFLVTDHSLQIYGYCEECQKRDK